MKVGILTFHSAMNYGAVLQAYALQTKIKSFAVECDIIDYRCEAFKKVYSPFYMSEKSARGLLSMLLYFPIRLLKYRKFNDFRKINLKLSNEAYDKSNCSELNGKYDLIIVGSDQVWNTELTNFDPTYFLACVNDKTLKASYAASLGTTMLTDPQKEMFDKYLDGFEFISVREKSSEELLKAITDKNVISVVDPVFLLSKDYWVNSFCGTKKNGKYIFSYCLHEKSIYEYSSAIAKQMKANIMTVPDSLRVKADGQLKRTLGISELLTYIYHSDMVVTDSFHVLALSIILQKEVRVVMKKNFQELNGRLLDLLRSLELEHIIINEENILNTLENCIDYDKTETLISEQVEKSEEYLKKILGC